MKRAVVVVASIIFALATGSVAKGQATPRPDIHHMNALTKIRADRDCVANETYVGGVRYRQCLGTNVVGCWNNPPLTNGYGYCKVEMFLAIHASPMEYLQVCETVMQYRQVGTTLRKYKYVWTCSTKF